MNWMFSSCSKEDLDFSLCSKQIYLSTWWLLCYTLADSNISIMAIPCCNSYSTGWFSFWDYLAHWWILGLVSSYYFYFETLGKAFKKAAESVEKLLDVTREELPDTMAAIRLSGMEISDLTMELSDLGFVSVFAHTPTITCQFFFLLFFSYSSILCSQGITQGVKSSTRAIRVAEDRLRRLTNTNPGLAIIPNTLFSNYGPWRLTPFLTSSVASMQEGMHQSKTEEREPMVAKTARGLKEGIVKGRSLWQLFFTITRFSKIATSYLGKAS